MKFPRKPLCRVFRGPGFSGSAIIFLTHMRPRHNVFFVISPKGSPRGVKAKGMRPIQLSFGRAYRGISIRFGISAQRGYAHS